MSYCIIFKDYYYDHDDHRTEYDTVELFEDAEELRVRIEYFVTKQIVFKVFATTPITVKTKIEIINMDSGLIIC